jgi:molecular chaperone HscB
MNYFELFDIPVQLKVDKNKLARKFFELSKKYHPDYYINDHPELQAEVLEKSAMLNKALKTFQDPDETIKYVLQLKGLLEEEEKYQLPPDFLMEVMEMNEQLMDTETTNLSHLGVRLTAMQAEIYEPVKQIIQEYNHETTSVTALEKVKEYYFKKKYLDRIKQQLAGMA